MRYQEVHNFIDGNFVKSNATRLDVYSPLNGQVITTVPLSKSKKERYSVLEWIEHVVGWLMISCVFQTKILEIEILCRLNPSVARIITIPTVKMIQYTIFFPLKGLNPFKCLFWEIRKFKTFFSLYFTCSFRLSRKLDFFLNLLWIHFCIWAEKVRFTKVNYWIIFTKMFKCSNLLSSKRHQLTNFLVILRI